MRWSSPAYRKTCGEQTLGMNRAIHSIHTYICTVLCSEGMADIYLHQYILCMYCMYYLPAPFTRYEAHSVEL